MTRLEVRPGITNIRGILFGPSRSVITLSNFLIGELKPSDRKKVTVVTSVTTLPSLYGHARRTRGGECAHIPLYRKYVGTGAAGVCRLGGGSSAAYNQANS